MSRFVNKDVREYCDEQYASGSILNYRCQYEQRINGVLECIEFVLNIEYIVSRWGGLIIDGITAISQETEREYTFSLASAHYIDVDGIEYELTPEQLQCLDRAL